MTSQPMTPAKENSYCRKLDVFDGDAGQGPQVSQMGHLTATGWGVTPPSRPASDPCQGDSQSRHLSCLRTVS